MAIGEDFYSQVGDGTVKTTLYKVRWQGYEKKGRHVGAYHSCLTIPWKDPVKHIEDSKRMCVLLPLEKSLDFISVWSILVG